jgi:hypothetical protein
MDLLGDTLKEIESVELLFNVSTPSPTRSAHVVINATQILMRQATSTTLLPPRMTGEHDLYNAILDFVASKGLGWQMEQLDSAAEFLKHITAAFWALNEKVTMHTSSFSASSFTGKNSELLWFLI